MLEIVKASKSFNELTVLNNINLTVEKGKIIGLAGPSGSGKSTLLRCIQRLEEFDSGVINSSGTSGFMFQDFQLFPHMTVMENLTYAPNKNGNLKENKIQAYKLLSKLRIESKESSFPHELSGGQKQRVALARSLMMSPSLLLCDEPTSGLDQGTVSEVVTLLKSVRDMGITMVISSHDLNFLSQIADETISLEKGKIVSIFKS